MIVVKGLRVRLGSFTLRVDRLEVRDGEYLMVLGPSGVGKTLLLHTLAGLLRPDEGAVLVDGVDVTNTPPEKRGFALVPQNYALFPNMNVYDNIAYGLRIRGLRDDVIEARVRELAEALEITHLLRRRTSELSGGEQQRVAVARALAIRPRILLLDEPFASLDPRLRGRARELLSRVHKELGFTALHVTHDIIEAICLGDRVAYMEGGRLLHVSSIDEFLRTKYAEPYVSSLKPALSKLLNIIR